MQGPMKGAVAQGCSPQFVNLQSAAKEVRDRVLAADEGGASGERLSRIPPRGVAELPAGLLVAITARRLP